MSRMNGKKTHTHTTEIMKMDLEGIAPKLEAEISLPIVLYQGQMDLIMLLLKVGIQY